MNLRFPFRSLLLSVFLLTAPMLFAATQQNGPGEYTFAHPAMRDTWKTTAGLPPDFTAISSTCGYSKREQTVYLLAESCGLGKGYECEYTLVSRLSDRAYESLAITWDLPSVIAKAVKALGVPAGTAANPMRGLTNGRGERFTVHCRDLTKTNASYEPLSSWLADGWSTQNQRLFLRGFPFTDATQNDRMMPSTVIANYTEPASLFGLPFQAAKSEAYGAFRARRDEPAGKPLAIALRWEKLPDGKARVLSHTLTVNTDTVARPLMMLETLRSLCEDPRDVFLDVRIDPSLEAAKVTKIAQLILSLEEQGGFTLDAPARGEVPLRAFVPDRTWLNRRARVFQPWEIEIAHATALRPPSATLCQIVEDWNTAGNDPALTRNCYPMVTPQTIRGVMKKVDVNAGKIYVAFFYAAPGTTVGEISPYTDALAEVCPTQWVFTDTRPAPLTESEKKGNNDSGEK